MQTPVASTETSVGRYTKLWGMPFLTATAVKPFEVSDVSLKVGLHLLVSHADVY
jgi:hypothetical protein